MDQPRHKVVLDTSVMVAAMRSRQGASAELLKLLVAGAYSIAISATLVFEYEEVLVRDVVPQFASLDEIDQLIRVVCKIGEKYDPPPVARPLLTDPDDDFLVELAVAAGIQYVVTHNIRHLTGAQTYRITAITPGRFLRLLREQP